jgi:hypothetical protein
MNNAVEAMCNQDAKMLVHCVSFQSRIDNKFSKYIEPTSGRASLIFSYPRDWLKASALRNAAASCCRRHPPPPHYRTNVEKISRPHLSLDGVEKFYLAPHILLDDVEGFDRAHHLPLNGVENPPRPPHLPLNGVVKVSQRC